MFSLKINKKENHAKWTWASHVKKECKVSWSRVDVLCPSTWIVGVNQNCQKVEVNPTTLICWGYYRT